MQITQIPKPINKKKTVIVRIKPHFSKRGHWQSATIRTTEIMWSWGHPLKHSQTIWCNVYCVTAWANANEQEDKSQRPQRTKKSCIFHVSGQAVCESVEGVMPYCVLLQYVTLPPTQLRGTAGRSQPWWLPPFLRKTEKPAQRGHVVIIQPVHWLAEPGDHSQRATLSVQLVLYIGPSGLPHTHTHIRCSPPSCRQKVICSHLQTCRASAYQYRVIHSAARFRQQHTGLSVDSKTDEDEVIMINEEEDRAILKLYIIIYLIQMPWDLEGDHPKWPPDRHNIFPSRIAAASCYKLWQLLR